MAKPRKQRCVVIVGAGFAGFHAARECDFQSFMALNLQRYVAWSRRDGGMVPRQSLSRAGRVVGKIL
jgi:hypothetical protein